MGSLFGSKTETTQQPYEQNPWKPQQPFLQHGFEEGRDALDNALSNIPSNLVAGLNEGQLNNITGLNNWVSSGSGIARGITGSAQQGIGNIGQGANAFGGILERANGNYADRINNTAGALTPDVQGLIDAGIRDAQTAFDRDVQSINGAAVGSGNINSTRAGALEARALDDAQDRVADLSANLRYGASQDALDRAMVLDGQQTQDMFGAASGVLDSGLASAGAASGAVDSGIGWGNNGLMANSVLQQQQQQEIEGQLRAAGLPLDFVSQYMGAIGGNYGGNGFTTQTTQSPSIFQQLAGTAIGVAGALG